MAVVGLFRSSLSVAASGLLLKLTHYPMLGSSNELDLAELLRRYRLLRPAPTPYPFTERARLRIQPQRRKQDTLHSEIEAATQAIIRTVSSGTLKTTKRVSAILGVVSCGVETPACRPMGGARGGNITPSGTAVGLGGQPA